MDNRSAATSDRAALASPSTGWAVVIPVKRLSQAKTRLHTTGPATRDQYALAFARDTVAAALNCPIVSTVLVATSDPEVVTAVIADGGVVCDDSRHPGLNPAIAHAATAWQNRHVAVITADLPALDSTTLAEALRRTESHARCFVPDAAGTGTVLLAAASGDTLRPCFGPDSARRHLASGAVSVPGDWPRLRRDVDTAADLAVAARLGLGCHTRTLLSSGR